MIEITSLRVRTYELDYIDIFWELSATDEEIQSYDFYVLRSIDGAAGPYRILAGPFYNTFMLRDPEVHQLNRWRNYFYKIRVVHRQTGDTREFGPQYLAAEPDRIALEIQRRNRLLFQEFAGRLVLLYPVMTFGQRCKHCWDLGSKGNTISRSKQQNCGTCFDTTFVGGYASPIAIYCQIDPYASAIQRGDTGETHFTETTARTSSFPPLKPRDMLVEAENIRWRIETVTSTQKGRAIVRQEMKLRQYSRSDVRHAVPVNLDLLTQHSPVREFTRPMSLQARELEVVDDNIGETS